MVLWGCRAHFTPLTSAAKLGRGAWRVPRLVWISRTRAQHRSERDVAGIFPNGGALWGCSRHWPPSAGREGCIAVIVSKPSAINSEESVKPGK